MVKGGIYKVLFQYIDKNLQEVIKNPQNVMFIKPLYKKNKLALYAIVKEKEGIYKKVQLTKEQNKLEFPFEPICHFYNGPGYFYLKDFLIFNNWIAVNIFNLDGFESVPWGERNKNTSVYAVFNDGSAVFVDVKNTKKFGKDGGLQKYTDLLKPYKEPSLTHDTYEVIEYYDNENDTFVIPKLKNISNKQTETEPFKILNEYIENNPEEAKEIAQMTLVETDEI